MKKHKWLIRPSQMGKLMKGGRKKDELFGKTALDCIKENVLLHKFGIEPEHVETKQMEKGTFNEAKNIDIASRVLGWKNVKGSDEKFRLANNYLIGEPDVNTDTLLADIKSSWSANTFPFFDNPNNPDYIAQLQCYMELTGHTQAELVYVLSNNPEHITQNEIERLTHYYSKRPHLFNAEGIEDLWSMAEIKATEIVHKQAHVEHIPEESRVKRFIIQRDEEFITEMKTRVEQARIIFDNLYELL